MHTMLLYGGYKIFYFLHKFDFKTDEVNVFFFLSTFLLSLVVYKNKTIKIISTCPLKIIQ